MFYAIEFGRCPCGQAATHQIRGPHNAYDKKVCRRCVDKQLKELETAWQGIAARESQP